MIFNKKLKIVVSWPSHRQERDGQQWLWSVIDWWQKQDKWASKDIYFEDSLITRAWSVCARKRLAIIPNLRKKSLESYLDRKKRRDCQKEKNEICCPVCHSGGIFVKNFQTGCEHAYHVNETKITNVNCLNKHHKFNKSCIICGNKKISLINYDRYNCVSDATFRFFVSHCSLCLR